MNQQEAHDLAERITVQEQHIRATTQQINKHNWRLRLTFRPGSPDALTLPAGTSKEWQVIKAMWASLPVRIGV